MTSYTDTTPEPTPAGHHDGRALDLLKCTHWGTELSGTMRLLNHAWNRPVIDTDGLGDDYTAVQQVRVFLDAAASDVVERPDERPMEPRDLEYELATIKVFRTVAERARQAAELAERIADTLQAPYNAEEGE